MEAADNVQRDDDDDESLPPKLRSHDGGPPMSLMGC